MTPTDPLVDEAIEQIAVSAYERGWKDGCETMIEDYPDAMVAVPHKDAMSEGCGNFLQESVWPKLTAMRAVSQEGLGEQHDGQPIGVHAYECRKCGKDIDAMKADPVCKPPKADALDDAQYDAPSTAADAQDDAEYRARLADWLNAFKADPFSTGADKVDRLIEVARRSPVTSPDTILVEAAGALVARIERLSDGQCGPFAIRNSIANSPEMDALRIALSSTANPIGETGA
jgi:hypothetical protein